jgi:hypothetical protein
MKVLFILFTFVVQCGLAQTIPVFQVLYAEKASLNNGTTLKSLDKLTEEIIHVSDSGYLILIHETGIPIEFSSDTTILLKELHSILNPPSAKSLSTFQKSVSLDYLFVLQSAEAKRIRLSHMGASHDDRLAYVIYPPLINGRIYFSKDVMIVWKPNIGTEIIVKVMNVYDEKLRSYEVKDNHVLIPEVELNYQNVNCIITFSPPTEKERKGKTSESQIVHFISRFYTNKIDFPYSAEVKTPAAALMTGYFFELASWETSEEAQSYYELATRLSDNKFYKEMLSNYLKRTGQ